MNKKHLIFSILMLLFFLPVWAMDEDEDCEMETDTREYTTGFSSDDCRFKNRYFHHDQPHAYWVMEPGWQVVLEGEDDDEFVRVEITVLNETEWVDGVRTRVIEEREFIDEELYEVSRNFFAICAQTNDVYYFGEDVDFYEDGEIVSHDGSWRAGEDGAEPGILLPGTCLAGARFFQEMYPGEAEDRAEILSISDQEVDDVLYEDALVLLEGSPLESPCDTSIKIFAPGIGMVADEDLVLVEAGFLFRLTPYFPFKK
jgi:hypothetical protein